MLTRKQHELLIFIHEHLQTTGFSPSFDEMKVGLSLRSKSGIHRLISALEERGFLRRRAHRARALEVVRLPGALLQESNHIERSKMANVVQGQFGRASGGDRANAVSLPLFGRVAAGSPIEAFRDLGKFIDVPASMISSGEYYVVEVSGDSMNEVGIIDGDIAIIKRVDNADSGEIVVVLIDKNEVTIKKLRKKGNSIALEPANRTYETRIFGPDRIEVQGKLSGILRWY